MIDIKLIITASLALLLVTACDDTFDPTHVDFSEISVAAHSGIDAGLDGSYTTGCYPGVSGTVIEDLRIRGNTWNYTIIEYTSADCTSGGVQGTISGTFQVNGTNIPTTDWFNASGISAPPPPAAIGDGSSLGATENVTPLLLTISGATGSLSTSTGTSPFFYVVDDSGANNVLYRDFNFANRTVGNFSPLIKTDFNSTQISVVTHSAVDTGLNGSYNITCYLNGGGSASELLVIEGNQWNYTLNTYTTANCSGTASTSTMTASFKIDGTVISTGWVDASGVSAAPPPAAIGDGSPLGVTETVTPLLLTIFSASGSLFGSSGTSSLFYVVDDTGTNNFLYRHYDFATGTASNFNPYVKQ